MSRREIKFQIDESEDPDSKFATDVNVCDVDAKLHHLIDPDELVIEDPIIELVIDYPLSTASRRLVQNGRGQHGFTRSALLRAIAKEYRDVYREEDPRSDEMIPRVGSLLNRCQTEGPHGIWGHDIGDLVIEAIYVRRRKDDIPIVTLGMGS